jgi:hypothetical protein
MAATVKIWGFNGAGPTGATVDSADAASARLGRDDLLISTASVPIPGSAGENFSYRKYYGLDVTATSTTSISNRKINMSAALTTGLFLWWFSTATYTQNTGTTGTVAGNYPAAGGTNGFTPANPADGTYAAMTTSAVVYDAASVATSSTGLNGKYVNVVGGVDFTYAAGGGPATEGNLVFTYDES